MYKLKMENVGLRKYGYEYYRGCAKAVYEGPQYSFEVELGTRVVIGGMGTGVCGQSSCSGIYGGQLFDSKINKFLKEGKPLPSYEASLGLWKEIGENGAFKEIQNYLLKNLVEAFTGMFPNCTVIFGGRANVSVAKFQSYWGVYSGSFGRYISKNKLGTITVSHLHQNPNHKSALDFSLQQVFVWSPDSILVPPVNRRYCGVFHKEEHSDKSMPKMLQILGKTAKAVQLRPRYYLKNPFMKDDAEVT